MKLFRAWLALCSLLFLSHNASAQFTYYTNGDVITVSGYTGSIPASLTISNFVTAIGVTAFTNSTTLTSVTIPASVTSIGAEGFYGCGGSIYFTDSAWTNNASRFYSIVFP